MNRRFLKSALTIAFFFWSFQAFQSRAQTDYKIFFVGDAGDHTQPGETLINLGKELLANPNSAVLFMGDNSYRDALWGLLPLGFKGFDSTKNTRDKINSQLSILENYKGSVFFIPGNHDWWNRTKFEKGRPKLAMEQSFIEKTLKANHSIANPDRVFLPTNGDYGPDFVEINNQSIRIVFIDTYRVIQDGIKKQKIPVEESSFYTRLDSIINEGYQKKQKIIVAAHHPVFAVGPVNRFLKRPYFFSRIKASYIDFPSYQVMADKINTILIKYPGIYYASGHLHALQYVYMKNQVRYIISGAGSKEKKISNQESLQYNSQPYPPISELVMEWNTGGFITIDFTNTPETGLLYYNNGSEKCTIP